MTYTCQNCGERILDVVEIIEHGCDHVLRAEDLSKREQSTLLYINSRVIDHRGTLLHEQMNFEDQQNIKLFTGDDLIHIEGWQVVEINEGYWDLVRDCQKLRAERNAGEMVIA